MTYVLQFKKLVSCFVVIYVLLRFQKLHNTPSPLSENRT